jgi:hypothetical protein
MADYAKLLRNGVKLAKQQTDSIQATVTLRQWTGQDGYGTDTFSAPKTYKAICIHSPTAKLMTDGRVMSFHAYAAFLEPVTPGGAAGRMEPIDPRDIIVFPDGTTGPILEVKGLVDAGTGKRMYSEVWMGQAGSRAIDA